MMSKKEIQDWLMESQKILDEVNSGNLEFPSADYNDLELEVEILEVILK